MITLIAAVIVCLFLLSIDITLARILKQVKQIKIILNEQNKKATEGQPS